MKRLIRFYEGYIEDDTLWFSNLNYNAFLKMNIETGTVEFIDKFPKARENRRDLHLRVIKHEEILYFVPYKNNVIHRWNLKQQKWEEEIVLPYPEDIVIEDAVCQNQEIWIFPASLKNVIVKVDLAEEVVKSLSVLTEKINEVNGEAASLISCGITSSEKLFLLSLYQKNCIIAIDYKKEEIKEYYCIEDKKIAGIKLLEENLCCIWLVDSGDILFWHISENKIKKVSTNVELPYGKRAFQNMIRMDQNRFLLVPCHINKLLWLDRLEEIVHGLEMPSDFRRQTVYTLFLYAQKVKDKIYLFPCGGNALMCVDVNTLIVSKVDFIVSDEVVTYAFPILEKNFEDVCSKGEMWETAGWNDILPGFLDFVCQKKEHDDVKTVIGVGEKIYMQIKNSIE